VPWSAILKPTHTTADLVASERICWRAPVILSMPLIGDRGKVGTIDVDIETGQLMITQQERCVSRPPSSSGLQPGCDQWYQVAVGLAVRPCNIMRVRVVGVTS
jgi:hypothetical protein